MKTTNIYILIDPRDQQVRYVGKANNPVQRLKNHLNKAYNPPSHKRNWIEYLKKLGVKPLMEIIDEVPMEDWVFWEMFWISQFKTWGFNLCNHTEGGDGHTFGNKASFKKGHIPWNKNNGNIKTCIICNKNFVMCKSGRNTCSQKCEHVYRSTVKNSGRFTKNNKPWNFNLKGVKLKPDKNIYQYSKDRKIFIRKWNTAKEAAIKLNLNEEGLGQCARNKSKSSGGYWWSYVKIKL